MNDFPSQLMRGGLSGLSGLSGCGCGSNRPSQSQIVFPARLEVSPDMITKILLAAIALGILLKR